MDIKKYISPFKKDKRVSFTSKEINNIKLHLFLLQLLHGTFIYFRTTNNCSMIHPRL